MNVKVKQVDDDNTSIIMSQVRSTFLMLMPPAIARVLFAALVGTLISSLAFYLGLSKPIVIMIGMVVIGIVMALTHFDETPASTS